MHCIIRICAAVAPEGIGADNGLWAGTGTPVSLDASLQVAAISLVFTASSTP
jgi:hypothetical protein